MTLHEEILDANQRALLGELKVFQDTPIYLAGGTALALQLGHRTSLDFDFDTSEQFDNKKMAALIRKIPLSHEIPENQPQNTFLGKINDVNLSIFYYPYKVLNPFVSFPPIVIAGLEDIAAMKIAAIVQRAKKRDFFDLYYLIEKLGLNNILKAAYQKYPWYEENNTVVKAALTYFDEANKDEDISNVTIFDTSVSWNRVKESLRRVIFH